MALVIDDRVKETSTTTGTGTLDLSGAVSGFQTFVAGVGDGNTTYYAIVNRDAAEWETGLGTVADASTDTLARTTVIASSNSDSAVDFSAGTKDVFTTLPASKAVFEDGSNDVTLANDLILGSDSAVLKFGADSDTTLTHTDGTGLTLNSTNKLTFQDTGTYIYSNADGDLDLVSDGTAVDSINLESAGGITLDAGTAGSGVVYEDDGTEMARLYNSSSNVILETKVSDADFSIKGNDGGSAITALSLDMSAAGAATFNDKVVATELDISGNMDIDGTSNLDAVDIDGAVQIDNTVTVGVDDTGYDVKFFGDTASAYMLWDTSTDDLILAGAAKLYLYDAAGGESLSSDGTDLTINAGTDLNLTAGTDINIPADVGLTFGNDGEKIEGDGTDLTISGNNINLTATADVNIPSGVGLTFATAEKIESDGTDLTITVGSNGDINIGQDIGLTFGDDGEKIEGDGTNLTIASSGDLNLAAGGSTNQIKVTDGAILPITDDDVDLGSSSYQFKNAYIDGTLEADAITIGGTAVTAGGASAGFALAMAVAL